ncbi:MAG: hypothetical protein ACRD72_26165 [Candidatus Angelobacter sp.]
MKVLRMLLAAPVLLAGAALAQNAPPPPSPQHTMTMLQDSGDANVIFFHTEMMEMHQTVKGAPYTATAVTESTQVLPDGNRIVNKQSGFVARDSEGRTRREMTMGKMGPLQVNSPKVIFIHDPVAQTGIVLNPDKQIAHVMKHDGTHMKMMGMGHGMTGKMSPAMQSAMAAKHAASGESKSESLGTQEIEGVTAQGTKVTRTIPAGTIGNELPLVITVESWTSPDLHALVLQKRNDPRSGETVYRLTNIKKGEPDASLFQVPSNFKVEQGPHPPAPAPPSE